jgi:hypothetical protein
MVETRREKLCLPIERQLDMGDMVAPMRASDMKLQALGRPLDRPLHLGGAGVTIASSA